VRERHTHTLRDTHTHIHKARARVEAAGIRAEGAFENKEPKPYIVSKDFTLNGVEHKLGDQIDLRGRTARALNNREGDQVVTLMSSGTQGVPNPAVEDLRRKRTESLDFDQSKSVALNLPLFISDGSGGERSFTIGDAIRIGWTQPSEVDQREMDAVTIGAMNSRRLTDEARRILETDPDALGAGGTMEAWLANLRTHTESLLDLVGATRGSRVSDNQATIEGHTVGDVLNSEMAENQDSLGHVANPLLRSIIIQLAYAQALTAGDGRGISDNDIKFALRIVSGGAVNKETVIALLDKLDTVSNQSHINKSRVKGGIVPASVDQILAYDNAFQAYRQNPFVDLPQETLNEIRLSMTPIMFKNLFHRVQVLQVQAGGAQ